MKYLEEGNGHVTSVQNILCKNEEWCVSPLLSLFDTTTVRKPEQLQKKNYGARDISISPPGDDDASTVGPAAAEVQRGGVLRMQGQLFAGPILLHTMDVNKNQ